MEKSKKIQILIIVLLHALGFPLLLLAVTLNAKLIIKNGKNYGLYAYAGIILVIVFILIYYTVFLIMILRKKKSPIKQGIVLSIVSMILFAGIFVFISKAAPDKLLEATSGTISYEDLISQYNDRAEINKKLLDDFIYLNTFGNGNLVYSDSKKPEDDKIKNKIVYKIKNQEPYKDIKKIKDNKYYLELATNLDEIKKNNQKEYKEEYNKWIIAKKDAYEYYSKVGYKSEKVKELAAGIFSSLDQDGFQNFSGPWMDFAASNIITVPVLVHLLLDSNKHAPSKPFPSVSSEGLRTKPVKWSVLDMMGPPLGISTYEYKDTINALYEIKKENIENNKTLSLEQKEKEKNAIETERRNKLLNAKYNNISEVPSMPIDLALIKNPIISDLFASSPDFVNGVYGLIHNIASSEGVVGSPLHATIDPNNGKINLSGSNISRGTLGYQNAAWFNSNNQIYMLISVFSTRIACILFSGYIIFISLLTGLLRQNKTHVEKEEKNINKIILNEIKLNNMEQKTLKEKESIKLIKPMI